MTRDDRQFEPARCWLCGEPAVWLVRENEDRHAEQLMTCERHKLAAFS